MKDKNYMPSHVLLIIGIIITSIGAVVTLWGTIQASREASNELQNSKNEILLESKNIILGGNSFLYIEPSKVANTNDVLFLVRFNGSFLLYDVTVVLKEYDLVQVERGQYKWEFLRDQTIHLGTVNPLKQFELLHRLEVPSGDFVQFGKKFFLKINSRNGMVEEDIVLRKEGPHFSQAYKVVRWVPEYSKNASSGNFVGEIIPEVRHIDPAFPVHQLDHLDGDTGWRAKYKERSGANFEGE